tara:strand:+ start:39 stop:485 length:447 start_codon:yes stop_codon:yes gene_type:complete
MNKYDDLKKQADLGELKTIEYFIKNGFEIYKQYTGKESVDLVVVKKDRMYRVECKSTSSRSSNDQSWLVRIFKTRHNSKKVRDISFTKWKDKIDLLAVYIEPIDYLLIFHKDEIKVDWKLRIKDEMIEVRNNDDCFKYEIFNNNVEEE